MKDLLNNDLHVGDKVAFLPRKENYGNFQYNIHYGMITELTIDQMGAYCKSISEPDYKVILRYPHQLIKL
jgi:hypothetical protein